MWQCAVQAISGGVGLDGLHALPERRVWGRCGHNRAGKGAFWGIPGMGLRIRAPTGQPTEGLLESSTQMFAWPQGCGRCC